MKRVKATENIERETTSEKRWEGKETSEENDWQAGGEKKLVSTEIKKKVNEEEDGQMDWERKTWRLMFLLLFFLSVCGILVAGF